MRAEPDYHDTPIEPPIRKTGRVCRYCKNTGVARGIRPMVWTEINRTDEYKNLNKEEKLEVQERFKDDIDCPFCEAVQRQEAWEKAHEYDAKEPK